MTLWLAYNLHDVIWIIIGSLVIKQYFIYITSPQNIWTLKELQVESENTI